MRPLRPNSLGIVWLTPSKVAATEYAAPYYAPRGYVWSVTLKPHRRVASLTDLESKPIRAFFNAANDVRASGLGGWSEEDWRERVDFGVLEQFRWAARFLAKRGLDAVVVRDSIGTTGIPHVSLALLRKSAIEDMTVEEVELPGRGRLLGDIERAVAAHEPKENPIRVDRAYSICRPEDGLLYVEVPSFAHLTTLLLNERFRSTPHLRTAEGYVPYHDSGIAFQAPSLFARGVRPLWYLQKGSRYESAIEQLIEDGVYEGVREAEQHHGQTQYASECEWKGPPGMRFDRRDVAFAWYTPRRAEEADVVRLSEALPWLDMRKEAP